MFLLAFKKIIYCSVMIALIITMGGCIEGIFHNESVRQSDYVVFEPMSLAYIEYTQPFYNFSGFIEGVENRLKEKNDSLSEYLTKIKVINDNYVKTPPSFANSEQWKVFKELAIKNNGKVIFYIKENNSPKNDSSLHPKCYKKIGLFILDEKNKIIFDHKIEESSF